ncbi:hypothetical protein AB3M95_24610 [Metabacillus niabensis]
MGKIEKTTITLDYTLIKTLRRRI